MNTARSIQATIVCSYSLLLLNLTKLRSRLVVLVSFPGRLYRMRKNSRISTSSHPRTLITKLVAEGHIFFKQTVTDKVFHSKSSSTRTAAKTKRVVNYFTRQAVLRLHSVELQITDLMNLKRFSETWQSQPSRSINPDLSGWEARKSMRNL